MKFAIQTVCLQKYLHAVRISVPIEAHPVIEPIKIEALIPNAVRLTGFRTVAQGIKGHFPGRVEVEGSIGVLPNDFLSIISKLDEGEILISSEGGWVSITDPRGHAYSFRCNTYDLTFL